MNLILRKKLRKTIIKENKKKYFNNGDFYEGEYRDRMRHGYGCFHFREGSYFKGNFVKG